MSHTKLYILIEFKCTECEQEKQSHLTKFNLSRVPFVLRLRNEYTSLKSICIYIYNISIIYISIKTTISLYLQWDLMKLSTRVDLNTKIAVC